MLKENWILIDEICDNEKITRGTKIRIFSDKLESYYDYIVSEIYCNREYFQITCISYYKAGIILCVIKKEAMKHYMMGIEFKRMLKYPDNKVLVCLDW